MKKKAIAIIMAGLLFLSGCARTGNSPDRGADTMRISAILPHHDYGYWTFVADGIRDAAQQLPVDVKIYTPDLNYNVELMTELILQQIAAQVDAIIVQGIDDPGYVAALEKARAEGICVVLVDTDLDSFAADLYVGTDNYDAGVQMGKRLVEVTGGHANVAILSGDLGYPNLEDRIRGIRDVAARNPDINLLRIEYNQYDAMTVMEKYYLILKENPEIDTLVAVEGTTGQTLGQMSSSGFRHILVFDECEKSIMGLKNGVFDGIICQQNYRMGVICIEELYSRSSAGSFRQNKIYTSIDWLTTENLEEKDYGR